MIPITLDLIYVMRDKTCGVATVRMMLFQRDLLPMSCRQICRGVGLPLKMEAQKRIAEEIIECSPGAIPVVSELRMAAIARYAEVFPLSDVGFRDVLFSLNVEACAISKRYLP